MKFNVGNRIRFVKKIINHSTKVKLGEIYQIKYIDSRSSVPYKIENGEWFSEEELTLPEYTYEDLKKSPIGTKITLEKIQDKQLVKTALNRIENDDYRFFIRDFEGLNTGNYGKIIKIEEPTYTTVYEYKPEILDEVEKRYLRGVIRPFRDKVTYIEKANAYDCSFIRIATNEEDIVLPHFKADAMYKGMKTNKAYTLEELGL